MAEKEGFEALFSLCISMENWITVYFLCSLLLFATQFFINCFGCFLSPGISDVGIYVSGHCGCGVAKYVLSILYSTLHSKSMVAKLWRSWWAVYWIPVASTYVA